LLLLGAARAGAAQYQVMLCSGNAASGGLAGDSSNWSKLTAVDHCGQPNNQDPPGESAYVRLYETTSGSVAENAYSQVYWASPAWTSFRQAGGLTREPSSFNAGWRARFAGIRYDGSAFASLNQGCGLGNSGADANCQDAFGTHYWPWAYQERFGVFAFQLICVRPAGCDAAGLNEADANGFRFVMSDDQDAQVSFTGGGAMLAGQWVRGAQPVAWQVSDAGSGMRAERLTVGGIDLDGVDWSGVCNLQGQNGQTWGRALSPCPPGGPWGRNYTLDTARLGDGPHPLTVCAQDFAQWQGLNGTGGQSCQTATIRTDNTAPVAPSNLAVRQTSGQHFSASWSNPDQGAGSPIASAHYEISEIGGSYDSGEQVAAGAGISSLDLSVPHDGDYRLRVWLGDAAGNADPARAAEKVFSTPPIARFTAGPADGALINDPRPTFAFESSKPGTFDCRLEAAAWAPCSSPDRIGPLSDGAHSFSVRPTDALGTAGEPITRTFTVDTTPPDPPGFSQRPNDPTAEHAAGFAFTGEGGASFSCALDGEPLHPCAARVDYSGLPDGKHQIDVRQTDRAGNTSAATSFAWTIAQPTLRTGDMIFDPRDPRNCALREFSVRARRGGIAVRMRSAVPRLVKVQVYRTGGDVNAKVPARNRLYRGRKRSADVHPQRSLIKRGSIRLSRPLRNYLLSRGGRLRLVPRVINEVGRCNGGSSGRGGYVRRFTTRLSIPTAVLVAWRLR